MYNPLIYDSNVTADAGYSGWVEISSKCTVIRLYPVSGTDPTVYLNDLNNTPPIILQEAMSLSNLDGRIKRVIVYGAAAVSVNIKQIQVPRGEIVRVGVNA